MKQNVSRFLKTINPAIKYTLYIFYVFYADIDLQRLDLKQYTRNMKVKVIEKQGKKSDTILQDGVTGNRGMEKQRQGQNGKRQ